MQQWCLSVALNEAVPTRSVVGMSRGCFQCPSYNLPAQGSTAPLTLLSFVQAMIQVGTSGPARPESCFDWTALCLSHSRRENHLAGWKAGKELASAYKYLASTCLTVVEVA